MLKNALFLKYQKIGSIICVVMAIILIFCGWFYEKKGDIELSKDDINKGKIIGDNKSTDDIFN